MKYKNIVKDKRFDELNVIFRRGLIRWECLRRNPHYIKCYKQKRSYYKLAHSVLINPKITDRDIERIAITNGIDWVVSREVTFVNLLGQISTSLKSKSPFDFIINKGDIFYEKSIPKVTLTVSLNFMKTEIMRAVDNALCRCFDDIAEKSDVKRKRTPDYNVEKRYLKVYDLKQQGLTFSKIAKKCYGNVKESTALFQVKREMKKAKMRVNGGYVKIW